MNKNLNLIFKEVLEEINPKEEVINSIQESFDIILEKIKKRIKKLKLDVEPFVGGSFAKGTLIKKDNYDIDLFLRFNKKYEEKNFRKLTKKILRKIKNVSILHGSRDYFQIKINPIFKIEVVPVRKIISPSQAENITDLSYSHVKYIVKKSKEKRILNEIKIAKAFCHGTKTYGAESYIHGFSGYSLELLIIYYRTFLNMLKKLSEDKEGKIIIDIEKMYKNKNQILMDLNGSKLISPIVLIDPTYKERNALAGLSDETFHNFKQKAKEFLKKPNKEFFFPKKENLEELKKEANNSQQEFIFLKLKTKKPSGDIAGTKLLKFFNHLKYELNKFYEISKSNFKYENKRFGEGYIILKKRKEIIFSGPKIYDKENIEKFKKEHKTLFKIDSNWYAKEQVTLLAKDFLKKWKKKNKKKIKQMYVSKIKIS